MLRFRADFGLKPIDCLDLKLNVPADPQVLISVRNAAEAEIALRFPLGVLDLKEPEHGALGMATESVCHEFLAVAGKKVVTSIAVGELKDWRADGFRRPEAWNWLGGFQYAKIGLAGLMAAGGDWQSRWGQFQQSLPPTTRLVGVAYADWQHCDAPPIESVIELMTSNRCSPPVSRGATHSLGLGIPQPIILLDTHSKSQGSVVDLLGWSRIESLIERARQLSLKLVVAGSLGLDHLPRLHQLAPDFIGFRGAVCEQGRARLSERKLRELFAICKPGQLNSGSTLSRF